ncbi:C-terminal domain phosphatase-like [Musa troglodytarum]|uniref:C-terminal domain phosphatase-like n=1 Tax=Musa troglodytarum TaxID=320322 RepID=A0A9E7ER41_9LILI|nr:C-terminal domain phosphatase-like [Musa troglodytarum]
MGRRPGISCKVYRGDVFLGEAEVFPAAKNSDGKGQSSPFPNTNEIRVDYLSFPASGAFPSPSSKPSPLSPSAANFKPGPTLIIPSSTDSTSHASKNARMRWWSPGAKSCILWQCRAGWKRSRVFGAARFRLTSTHLVWECSTSGALRLCSILTKPLWWPTP